MISHFPTIRPAVVVSLLCGPLLSTCGTDGGTYSAQDWNPPEDVGEVADAADVELDVPSLIDVAGVELEEPNELLVRIALSGVPAAQSFAVPNGDPSGAFKPSIVLTGFVFGAYDSLVAYTDEGLVKEAVVAEEAGKPFSYFQIPGVELRSPVEDVPGFFVARATRVWVVAKRADATAVDSAIVVANPGVVFPQQLSARPPTVYADQYAEVVFTLDLNRVENFDPNQVVLMETDSSCNNKIGAGVNMWDDGDLADTGDEIAQDQVYTRRLKLPAGPAGVKLYRGAVTSEVQGKKLVAYTPCIAVRTVKPFSQAVCEQSLAELNLAGSIYDTVLKNTGDKELARKSVVAYLRGRPSVAEAGASSDASPVWVAFGSGLLGVVEPSKVEAGTPTSLFEAIRNKPESTVLPASRRVLGAVHPTESEGELDKVLGGLKCPPLRRVSGADGAVASFRSAADDGVVFLASGGGPVFGGMSSGVREAAFLAAGTVDDPWPSWAGWDHRGSQDVVWTGEKLDCDDLSADVESCYYEKTGECCISCPYDPVAPDHGKSAWELCPEHQVCMVTHSSEDGTAMGTLFDPRHMDLAASTAVLGRGGRIGILPSFVAANARYALGPAFVFLGYSNSLSTGTMASEFLAGGANAVVGTTDSVGAKEGEQTGAALLGQLAKDGSTPWELVASLGDSTPGKWRMIGAGNVDLSYSGLINSDFATGSLHGWDHTGDARLLAQWCGVVPTGKYMALVSTGIGYTVQTGEISQEFCLAPDKTLLSASFDFISHEFIDQCGTDYDDTFEMLLKDSIDQTVAVARAGGVDRITVNHLCPPDAGECPACETPPDCVCGALFPPLDPWPMECMLDAADLDGAHHSTWRSLLPTNITPLKDPANQPVRLILRTSDAQGIGFTTTVLIDSIDLK